MQEFFTKLFDTSDFPQRWNCGTWTDFHGWVHILSDFAVFGAYVAIPVVCLFFMLRRPEVQFPSLFWLFCAFIFACGTVHLIEASIFWVPIYRISAVFKFVTAIASWATVFALIREFPKAIRLPSYRALNEQLEDEAELLRETKGKLECTLRELRESKRLTDSILQSINSGVILVDNSGQLILENAAAKVITGTSFTDCEPGGIAR